MKDDGLKGLRDIVEQIRDLRPLKWSPELEAQAARIAAQERPELTDEQITAWAEGLAASVAGADD